MQIYMNQGEHVNDVSGTSNSRGVTSLKIVTNQGCPAGDAFSVPLRQGKNEVVAFFGHSGDTLKSLGVYVPGAKECPVKVGPWGGHLGSSRDLYASNMPVQLAAEHRRPQQREVRRPRLWFLLQRPGQGRAAHQRGPLGLQDQRPAAQHLHERGQLHHFHQWHLRRLRHHLAQV